MHKLAHTFTVTRKENEMGGLRKVRIGVLMWEKKHLPLKKKKKTFTFFKKKIDLVSQMVITVVRLDKLNLSILSWPPNEKGGGI